MCEGTEKSRERRPPKGDFACGKGGGHELTRKNTERQATDHTDKHGLNKSPQ